MLINILKEKFSSLVRKMELLFHLWEYQKARYCQTIFTLGLYLTGIGYFQWIKIQLILGKLDKKLDLKLITQVIKLKLRLEYLRQKNVRFNFSEIERTGTRTNLMVDMTLIINSLKKLTYASIINVPFQYIFFLIFYHFFVFLTILTQLFEPFLDHLRFSIINLSCKMHLTKEDKDTLSR